MQRRCTREAGELGAAVRDAFVETWIREPRPPPASTMLEWWCALRRLTDELALFAKPDPFVSLKLELLAAGVGLVPDDLVALLVPCRFRVRAARLRDPGSEPALRGRRAEHVERLDILRRAVSRGEAIAPTLRELEDLAQPRAAEASEAWSAWRSAVLHHAE